MWKNTLRGFLLDEDKVSIDLRRGIDFACFVSKNIIYESYKKTCLL